LLLADIALFGNAINRAAEAVSVRDIRAIDPELFRGKREQFLIDLEAKVNLSTLDMTLLCLPDGFTARS